MAIQQRTFHWNVWAEQKRWKPVWECWSCDFPQGHILLNIKSPVQNSWRFLVAFIRPPPHIPHGTSTSLLPLPVKSSKSRTGAVWNVCCEIKQRYKTISPSPCAAAGSLFIPCSSFVIYHPLHPFFPCLRWDLLPSNRGMHRVTLTSGTAGAGLHVGRCPLCLCHWACTDETSVPRGAMGNDVPSTEPAVSATIWHISASRVHAHVSTHGRGWCCSHIPAYKHSNPFLYYTL